MDRKRIETRGYVRHSMQASKPVLTWDRFTDRARAAVWAADQEAAQRGQSEITTEHLLLGLLQDETNVACHLLKQAHILPQPLVAALVPHLSRSVDSDHPERHLSVDAKRAIEHAYGAARRLDSDNVGTGHLLLGLLLEENGLAGRILNENGVTTRQWLFVGGVAYAARGIAEDGATGHTDAAGRTVEECRGMKRR